MNISDLKTYKQILLTLQTIYGDFTNYGLLFGLSNTIAEELKFSTDNPKVSNDELTAFWNDNYNNFLSDLTYPCFITPYCDEENIDIIKRTANLFTDYIYGIDGSISLKELLSANCTDFESAFKEQMNGWFSSIGGSMKLIVKKVQIAFTVGGTSYPLVIKTLRAIYCIKDSFSELYKWIYQKDFFKDDYQTLVSTLLILESEMSEADRKLKVEGYDYGQYKVVLEEVSSLADSYAYYYGRNSKTCSASITALMHEYIHHLTKMYGGGSWQHELIAAAMGSFNYYAKIFYFNIYTILAPENPLYDIAFELHTGREYSYFDDIFITVDIFAYLDERYELTVKAGTALTSFSTYLIKEYGEETFIKFLTTNRYNPQAITGKIWNEMQADWIAWLESEYGYLKELLEDAA